MDSTTKYREEWSKAGINFLDLHVLLKMKKKTYFDDNTAWIVFVFGVFLVSIFPNSTWIRRDTEYLSVFSLNAGKYGPANLWIRTLFLQCKPTNSNQCLQTLLCRIIIAKKIYLTERSFVLKTFFAKASILIFIVKIVSFCKSSI